MGWFGKKNNTAQLQIAASTTTSGFTKFSQNDTFLIKVNQSTGLSKLDDMEELFDTQSFVIFKNDDDFYLRALPANYRYRDLEKYLNNEYWTECYIFGNVELSFPSGIEHIFVNRFLNTMRKFVDSGIIFNQYCNDGNPSNVMTVVEQNKYEKLWADLKAIMLNNAINVLPLETHSFSDVAKRSLFNISAIENSHESVIKTEYLPYIFSMSENNTIKYTLQDSLGHTVSAFTVHQLLAEWLKALYKIPMYRNMMFKIQREEEEGISWDYKRKVFGQVNRNDEFLPIADNLTLQVIDYVKTAVGSYRHSIYLSINDMKKTISLLASIFGLRINLEEKIILELPTNDPNFAEEMEQEELKRNEKRAELVAKLEEIAEEDFERFDEDFKNDEEMSRINHSTSYITPLDEVLDNGQNDGFEGYIEENRVRLKEKKVEQDREQKAAAMENALSELLDSSDQEFKKLFNN